LEAKDYLGLRRKKSGFEAYKIAIQQNHQVFEVQLQTEAMFKRENIGFRENHLTYKERQMGLRAKLGKQYQEVYKALEILLCSDGTYCQELAVGNRNTPLGIQSGCFSLNQEFKTKERIKMEAFLQAFCVEATLIPFLERH